jgi:hypothetical protein
MRLFSVVLILSSALSCGCAHQRKPPENDDASVIIETGIWYTIHHFADPEVLDGGMVCIEVDERAPSQSLLDRFRGNSFAVSGEESACVGTKRRSVLVSVGDLSLSGGRASLQVGIVLGSGGNLILRKANGVWRVVGVSGRWVASSD